MKMIHLSKMLGLKKQLQQMVNSYDENGNLITDANKGIINIACNHLNLPTQVMLAEDIVTIFIM